jgi:DNA-directed RNA polymerase subunit RPC12/RpoP
MAESQRTNPKQKPQTYRCPGCGGDLVFDPKNNCLTCPYCGRQEPIPQSAESVIERSYEQYLQPTSEQMGTLAENALEVSCERCGATVTFTPPEVAGECPFCGSAIVAQPKSADPMVAPEGVLPFRLTQQQANEVLKKWLSTRWFAPNALKKFAYHESIKGVYIPFWTYDADTRSYYTGERGEYYYVTESYTERDAQGNQVTKTRQVRMTRWHTASGEVARRFDDVLITATRSVSRARLASLEPWDLELINPYEPAYISGYKAQRYQVGLAEGFNEAKTIMDSVIEGDVRKDIGGDEQRVHNIDSSYSDITFKHILLPVYIGAYRFNQKIYQIMINARTGEVQGDRPYSAWKIAFLVLFLLLIAGIVIYLKNQ